MSKFRNGISQFGIARRKLEAPNSKLGGSLRFSHLQQSIRRGGWWLRWKLRGHARNHDPDFCNHRNRTWSWVAKDGCSGWVCDSCNMLERWVPTELPDVVKRSRRWLDGTVEDMAWWSRSSMLSKMEAWYRAEQRLAREAEEFAILIRSLDSPDQS